MLAAATLGVALAHHSHDRRAKTAETIVLPTGTGLPPTSATSTPTTTTVVSPDAEFIAQIGVISPGVGWALNGLALYRTIDDTATWTNMTPPGVTDARAQRGSSTVRKVMMKTEKITFVSRSARPKSSRKPEPANSRANAAERAAFTFWPALNRP